MESSGSEFNPGTPPNLVVPQLVDQYGGCLYQLGLRICGSHEEAQDLVQDTFLLAFQHWPQFRGEASPKTWLYSIAARVCFRSKRLRSGEPRELQSIEDLVLKTADRITEMEAAASPLQASIRKEGAEILSKAISELPLDFRLPLVLKDIAELSVKETASVLGLKEATVKTRVHRARLHLRKQLTHNLPSKTEHSAADQQICVDLVRAKLDAMDKKIPFSVTDDLICQRCASLLATLDLTQSACEAIGSGAMPEDFYQELRRVAIAGKQ